MYTSAALLDMHARGHRSLAGLIAHGATLGLRLLRREVPGFGIPTILLQLTHALSAEGYWIGVLQRRLPADTDEPDLADLAALEALRATTVSGTRAYLERTSEAARERGRQVPPSVHLGRSCHGDRAVRGAGPGGPHRGGSARNLLKVEPGSVPWRSAPAVVGAEVHGVGT